MNPEILIPIVVGVAALALGILAGIMLRKKIGEAKKTRNVFGSMFCRCITCK